MPSVPINQSRHICMNVQRTFVSPRLPCPSWWELPRLQAHACVDPINHAALKEQLAGRTHLVRQPLEHLRLLLLDHIHLLLAVLLARSVLALHARLGVVLVILLPAHTRAHMRRMRTGIGRACTVQLDCAIQLIHQQVANAAGDSWPVGWSDNSGQARCTRWLHTALNECSGPTAHAWRWARADKSGWLDEHPGVEGVEARQGQPILRMQPLYRKLTGSMPTVLKMQAALAQRGGRRRGGAARREREGAAHGALRFARP
eukprot:364715-Chlamydomonas_euryale.AAC.3